MMIMTKVTTASNNSINNNSTGYGKLPQTHVWTGAYINNTHKKEDKLGYRSIGLTIQLIKESWYEYISAILLIFDQSKVKKK